MAFCDTFCGSGYLLSFAFDSVVLDFESVVCDCEQLVSNKENKMEDRYTIFFMLNLLTIYVTKEKRFIIKC